MGDVTVVRTIWIQAPQERVWQAVTEAEQLSLWYAPGSPWEIPSLREGATLYFHHTPNEHHSGTEITTMAATIEVVDSPNRFAMRWVDEPTMVTTFLLSAENGGTRVTITETGYETKEQAQVTEEGYGMSLENLDAHIAGRSLPY